eukprot:scaffold11921_cov102-Isochrysis_galbana.AAC.3
MIRKDRECAAASRPAMRRLEGCFIVIRVHPAVAALGVLGWAAAAARAVLYTAPEADPWPSIRCVDVAAAAETSAEARAIGASAAEAAVAAAVQAMAATGEAAS